MDTYPNDFKLRRLTLVKLNFGCFYPITVNLSALSSFGAIWPSARGVPCAFGWISYKLLLPRRLECSCWRCDYPREDRDSPAGAHASGQRFARKTLEIAVGHIKVRFPVLNDEANRRIVRFRVPAQHSIYLFIQTRDYEHAFEARTNEEKCVIHAIPFFFPQLSPLGKVDDLVTNFLLLSFRFVSRFAYYITLCTRFA